MDENRIAGTARNFGGKRKKALVVSWAMRRRRFEEWPTKPPAPRRIYTVRRGTRLRTPLSPPVTLPRRSKSGCAGLSRLSPTLPP